MDAIREVYENSPAEVQLSLPKHLQNRRIEIIVLPIDDLPVNQAQSSKNKRYKTLPIQQRVIVSREELYER
ncbi:MAG: hypothetical protein VSS52_008870 [Thiotrichaceae bacterium]|nr:hypothetical protein [Thiotrichaceae bacterium]